MYAIQLPDGSYLSVNDHRLWFDHYHVARALVWDLGGRIWERIDFDYQI